MTQHQTPIMTTDALIAEIVHAEPHHLQPEQVRRCLDLLAEFVFAEAEEGRRVEVANFGTFVPSPEGGIRFEAER